MGSDGKEYKWGYRIFVEQEWSVCAALRLVSVVEDNLTLILHIM